MGLELHPTWRLSKREQFDTLRRVFREWGVTGVVDVGANAGQFARALRAEVGFGGPILSVEPIPSLVESILSQADSNWRVEACAVGECEGVGTFNIALGSEFSSMLSAQQDLNNIFAGQERPIKSIEVRISTLDLLIDQHTEWLGSRIFLKLDTQGFDVRCLEGLSAHSDNVVAAQTEAAFVRIYEGAPLIQDTLRAFEAQGFTLCNVFPNNGGHFPRLIEVDCVFVREKRRLEMYGSTGR